jgi:hypothetical protein
MRRWLLTTLSNRARRSSRWSLPTRPTLEPLEDRCVPTANLMPFMGMHNLFARPVGTFAPIVHTGASNLAALSTMNNAPGQSALAALNHLFADFNSTMRQVMSSQNLQQFLVNESAMLRIIAADLAQFRAAESPTIPMR